MFSQLKADWIVGWKNIITKKYVGDSHGYTCEQTAVGTTNGAGPQNVQLFMLAPDGTVLNCLPGFWHPEDLARELKLAQKLLTVWQDPSLSPAAKKLAFAELQRGELKRQPKETYARSAWQGFDAKNELKRIQKGVKRDTVKLDAEGKPLLNARGKPQMKTTNVVVKERMAARPFVPFAEFDTATFANYGRSYYDNNKKVDGAGTTFMTPKRVAKKEKRAKRKANKEARRKMRLERRARRAKRRGKPLDDLN